MFKTLGKVTVVLLYISNYIYNYILLYINSDTILFGILHSLCFPLQHGGLNLRLCACGANVLPLSYISTPELYPINREAHMDHRKGKVSTDLTCRQKTDLQ